jgi:uncharacterized protein YggE
MVAMSSTVSVSVRTLVAAGVTAVAAVLAFLAGSAQSGASPADAAAPVAAAVSPENASIAMSGTGETTGVPDQVAFTLTVRGHAADVTAALASANATTRRVLEAVRGQGVEVEDLQTTGLSLHPTYDYSNGQSVLTGYAATQRLSVLVRALPDAGATMSAAVEAGGNAVRLGNVRLQIGDKDALLAQARDAAIADAQAKAEQYAEAAGRPLGDVMSVREVSAPSPSPQPLAARDAEDAMKLAAVPIRAGTDDLRVTVSVVWSFA